jgi:hypothetical protein
VVHPTPLTIATPPPSARGGMHPTTPLVWREGGYQMRGSGGVAVGHSMVDWQLTACGRGTL